jgi:curved DNA-binding protein CbpA
MSDDTYYTRLDVLETATQLEIKTAYRNLLKKIHPDTVSTLSPELRRTAEDLTKEIIEAYEVLSDGGMRREYDRQLAELAEYRQQSVPAVPPREPKAAPTSTPRPYVPPRTQAPQPRVVARAVRLGAVVFFLLFWGAVARLIQQSDLLTPEPPRTESTFQQASGTASTNRPADVASYCKTHPTSFYGAPGAPSGVSCSDWVHLTIAEKKSIQAACSQSQYVGGPASFDRGCLARELREWESGPKQPDLSRLTRTEYNSIQAACSNEYLEGPAAYDRCMVRHLEAWEKGPKRPDLSHLTSEKQKSIASACSDEFMQGPAAYDRCLIRELEDTSILPSMRRSSMSHEVIRKTATSSFNSP